MELFSIRIQRTFQLVSTHPPFSGMAVPPFFGMSGTVCKQTARFMPRSEGTNAVQAGPPASSELSFQLNNLGHWRSLPAQGLFRQPVLTH